jgi:aminoglycoside phosphotransferase (APT) family kinase protein
MKKKNRYQLYLEKRHAKFQPSLKKLSEIVKKVTGSSALSFEKIIKGEVSQVYEVLTDNNKKIIIRISYQKQNSFQQEVWVLKKLRTLNLPVPEVLGIEKFKMAKKVVTVCIEKKLEGVALNELKLSTKRKRSILMQAGAILSRINAVPIKGFGPLKTNGQGIYKSLTIYILAREKEKQKLLRIAKKVGLDKKVILDGLVIIKTGADKYKNFEGRLLHHDYSAKHIIVQKNKIKGILDFELARSGDPVEDLARWEFFLEHEYPLKWLIKGYKNKNIFLRHFEKNKYFWKIHYGLGVLLYYYSEKNPDGLLWTKRRLIKDIKAYKRSN